MQFPTTAPSPSVVDTFPVLPTSSSCHLCDSSPITERQNQVRDSWGWDCYLRKRWERHLWTGTRPSCPEYSVAR